MRTLDDKFTAAESAITRRCAEPLPSELLRGADRTDASVQSKGLEDLDTGLRWKRVAEITAADPEPEDVPVENLIELGKLGCLIGDGGVGKSTLTEQLAGGLAVGHLWGQPLPRKYRVVLVNTEDDAADIKRSVLAGAGDDDPAVYHAVTNGSLSADDLERCLRETGAEVVFINPLIDLLKPVDENNNAEMAEKILPFKRLCLERRVCIWFVHHTNKSEGTGRNRSRGASALFDHCALFAELRVTKEGESWTLFFQKRRGGGPLRKPLTLRSNGRHFEPTEYTPPQTVSDSADTAILELLRSTPGHWHETGEIQSALQGLAGRSTVYERLKVVRRRGDVDYDPIKHAYRYRPADDPGAPPHTDADCEIFG